MSENEFKKSKDQIFIPKRALSFSTFSGDGTAPESQPSNTSLQESYSFWTVDNFFCLFLLFFDSLIPSFPPFPLCWIIPIFIQIIPRLYIIKQSSKTGTEIRIGYFKKGRIMTWAPQKQPKCSVRGQKQINPRKKKGSCVGCLWLDRRHDIFLEAEIVRSRMCLAVWKDLHLVASYKWKSGGGMRVAEEGSANPELACVDGLDEKGWQNQGLR